MKKQGFTLVELLAVIVILGIILVIAVPQVKDIIADMQLKAFKDDEKMVVKAAKNYITNNNIPLSSTAGNTYEITLKTLQDNNFLKVIEAPQDSSIDCNGYVIVTSLGGTKYDYTPYLNCENNIGSADEDQLAARYKFDDFQEPTTNLLPNPAINGYPTIGNTHNTYNTNQYNGATYFSIGTIGSVSSNIVTLSSVSHPIYTYDVLTPQTTGGGVTAGTYYFIKKLSSTTFTLHAYNSSQDGSQGFNVYNSIANDVRININATSFPTMWYGPAHLPNSALVKEIIHDGFSKDGIVHDCIRLHTEHKPDGGVDAMAYGVLPPVTAGHYYTFSFYYRAANQQSVGTDIALELYTGGGWNGDSIAKKVTSTDWQKYEISNLLAPNTGGTNLYFWPTKGAMIDISEIQCEEKPYATPFVAGSRTAVVKDYSGNNNIVSLTAPFAPSPKWVPDSINQGAYDFFNVNTYLVTDNVVPVTGNQTFTAWVKPESLSGLMGIATLHNHGSPSNIGMNICDNKIGVSIGYTDGTREYCDKVSSGIFAANTWSHIALTYNASTNAIRFYINGKYSSQATVTKTIKYTSEKLLIGEWSTAYIGSGYNMNGFIDDVQLYRRTLSDEEISQIYNSTLKE